MRALLDPFTREPAAHALARGAPRARRAWADGATRAQPRRAQPRPSRARKVGFTFYINQAMHLQHPIWHVHVVVAAICHFWPVVRYLVPLDGSGPEYARRA